MRGRSSERSTAFLISWSVMAGSDNHSSGFQHGGQRSAATALRAEYAATIAELERRRAAALGREEKERLQREIEVARSELVDRRKGLRWGLFGRA